MRRLLLATATLTALPLFAFAAPIAAGSELSINGSDNFTPTQVTFVGLGNVGGSLGSFTELVNCTACVAFSQPLTPLSTGLLYTVVDGADTSTLAISSVTSFVSGGTPALPNLTTIAHGTLTLTGFSPTPGEMELTTQGATGGINVTFSATSIPLGVPEPTSFAVLGAGLIGLGMLRRVRR
jgi:hypothetical protein